MVGGVGLRGHCGGEEIGLESLRMRVRNPWRDRVGGRGGLEWDGLGLMSEVRRLHWLTVIGWGFLGRLS